MTAGFLVLKPEGASPFLRITVVCHRSHGQATTCGNPCRSCVRGKSIRAPHGLWIGSDPFSRLTMASNGARPLGGWEWGGSMHSFRHANLRERQISRNPSTRKKLRRWSEECRLTCLNGRSQSKEVLRMRTISNGATRNLVRDAQNSVQKRSIQDVQIITSSICQRLDRIRCGGHGGVPRHHQSPGSQ